LRRASSPASRPALRVPTAASCHHLPGLPEALYEKAYCARGQAENPIKAHKLHLASDRTSCTKATASQFRLLIHTAAYWLMWSLRRLAPRTSFWRDAQFDTIRLCLIKAAWSRHRDGHPHQDRPTDRLPLPDRLRHVRRTHRQAAAANTGVACPETNLSAQPQTLLTRVTGATNSHCHGAVARLHSRSRTWIDPG
jgi:hypothetical protein